MKVNVIWIKSVFLLTMTQLVNYPMSAQEPGQVIHYMVGTDICKDKKCTAVNVDIDLLGDYPVVKNYAESFFFGGNEKGLDNAIINFLDSLDTENAEPYVWNFSANKRGVVKGNYAYILDETGNSLENAMGFREKWVESHAYHSKYKFNLQTFASMRKNLFLSTISDKTRDLFEARIKQEEKLSNKYGFSMIFGVFHSYSISYEKYVDLQKNIETNQLNYAFQDTRIRKFVYDVKNCRILEIENILKPEYVNEIKKNAKTDIQIEMRTMAIIFEQIVNGKEKMLEVYPYKKSEVFTDEFKELIQCIDTK